MFFASCTVVKNFDPNKPFIFKNNISLKIDEVTPDEKIIIKSRLNNQLDDSAKVRTKDVAFILHFMNAPPAIDTNALQRSLDNMISSLASVGYYNAKGNYKYLIDTIDRKHEYRVTTNYTLDAGKRTLIDTMAYLLAKPELQLMALKSVKESPLQKGVPIRKSAILEDEARLTDTFRNNGYYKFTTDELRLTGDTSIEALTRVANDPFEALQLLAEANEKKNKPTIRLGMVLNTTSDSSRFKKYYINNIYIMPDYKSGDEFTDSVFHKKVFPNYSLLYHEKKFNDKLFTHRMEMVKGHEYNQQQYLNTLNNFYKLGVWESPVIDIIERKDSLLDMVVKMTPSKKYAFEGGIELSYSANSSSSISPVNSGNLLGISGNLSILNRNLHSDAIKMTNAIRAGVELNTSQRNTNGSFLNSTVLSYSNNILIPNNKKLFKQAFINTNISQINRIDFYNQQVFNTTFGINYIKKANHTRTIRFFNLDFRRIYNRSDRFDQTLLTYPFLKYSFNTALVLGSSFNYNYTYINPVHNERHNNFKFNVEESGLEYGWLRNVLNNTNKDNFLEKYLKEFIKSDFEYTHTVTRTKTAMVYRAFLGVGIPLTNRDTTLPFFKQYFGGGPNSMRGWPVRGIGVGGQSLAPYGSSFFNDRTGDIQLEGNIEYRYNIAHLFSNSVLLKGALFTDVGNVWNMKNSKADGSLDSAQFKFKNLYKQLGVSAGTGFRLDFNYFLIRFDLGFRFKRPDITKHDGWQIPSINFHNLFGNSDDAKRWRYENYNFTIGIDYPFLGTD
ncbi:MAG: BamA/TamA family outer membrane protein [Ginsengibacter sp.]